MKPNKRRYYQRRYPASVVSLQCLKAGNWKTLIGPDQTFSATGPLVDDLGNPTTNPVQSRGLMAMGAWTQMLQNSKFEGAVSGTPGTAPTNWDLLQVGEVGTTTVGTDRSITYTIGGAGGRLINRQTVSVGANTVYRYSANVSVLIGPIRTEELINIITLPAGATVVFYVNNVLTASTTNLSVGTYYIEILLTVSSTAGSPSFRLGLSAAGTTVVGSAKISMPQLVASAYAYPYAASGPGQTITVPTAGGTTGGNGTSTLLSDKMKSAIDTGGVFTIVAIVYVGAGSAEMPASSDINILTPSASTVALRTYRISGSDRIIGAHDGTTNNIILSSWNRDEIHLKVVQTNALGTQFRVGNRRYSSSMVPIDALTWGSWAAYDGSLGPLTHLRLALNGTIPLWFRLVSLSNKSLTDSQILNQVRYVR